MCAKLSALGCGTVHPEKGYPLGTAFYHFLGQLSVTVFIAHL
jgi:hypothetical protein